MPKPRRARNLDIDLAPDRVLHAVETLTAAAACYNARPAAHQLPSDTELAKHLAEVVDAVEGLAVHAASLAEGILVVQLKESLLEAYQALSARKPSRHKPRLAPGGQMDHMVDWKAGGKVLARGRIQAAWQQYTVMRFGEVSQLPDDAVDYLVSKDFMTTDAERSGMGPVDAAARAADWLVRCAAGGTPAEERARPIAARTLTGLPQNERWPWNEGDAVAHGQPPGGDWGWMFGAQPSTGGGEAIAAYAESVATRLGNPARRRKVAVGAAMGRTEPASWVSPKPPPPRAPPKPAATSKRGWSLTSRKPDQT